MTMGMGAATAGVTVVTAVDATVDLKLVLCPHFHWKSFLRACIILVRVLICCQVTSGQFRFLVQPQTLIRPLTPVLPRLDC